MPTDPVPKPINVLRLNHIQVFVYHMDLSSRTHQWIHFVLPLTICHILVQKLPMTPDIRKSLCNICDLIGDVGTVLKVAFILSCYGFLRQSNIAPSSPSAFNPSHHTTRDDMKLQPHGLVVTLKWSTTHQVPGVLNLIPIPSVPGHPMDLLAAFMHMLHVATSSPPTPQLSRCCYFLAGALSPAAISRGPSGIPSGIM